MKFTRNYHVPNWDDYFMSMVYLVASKSKDERTHIGTVVVGQDNEIKSTSYNSFVRRLVGVKVRYWEGKLLNIEKFRRGEFIGENSLNKNLQESKIETQNKMKVKIKKLHPDATIPSYAHPGDAGMDLFSVEEDFVLKLGQRKMIGTGISMELPEGYVALVWDKSGVGAKGIKRLGGVIDCHYRGEYKVVLINLSSEDYEIKKGQKIAQLLIQKIENPEIEEAENLSDTLRGDGGFGSTGVN